MINSLILLSKAFFIDYNTGVYLNHFWAELKSARLKYGDAFASNKMAAIGNFICLNVGTRF